MVRRIHLPGLRVRWSVPVPRRFRRPALTHNVAHVMDLSVTGALVCAPATEHLEVGSVVGIELEGLRGTVVIRHVYDPGKGGERCYGVEFDRLQPELRQLIFDAVGQGRRELEWSWLAGS